MGPVMNLLLAVVVMAVVLYQGAQRAGLRAAAGRRSARSPSSSVGEGAGAQASAIASSPSTASRSRPGNSSRWRSSPKAKREVTHRVRCATASRVSVTVVPDGAGQVRDRRHRRAAGRAPADRRGQHGAAGRRGRAADRRRHPGGGRRAERRATSSCIDAIKAQRRQAAAARRSSAAAACRTIDRHAAADRRQGDDRRAAQRVRDRARSSPARSRRVKLSVAKNWEWTHADRPDARRPVHARDVGQAADGTGRDRRSVGHRGAGRAGFRSSA